MARLGDAAPGFASNPLEVEPKGLEKLMNRDAP
jgi:hypothetical protein